MATTENVTTKNTGILAEFSNPKTLCDAAKAVREAGYQKFDAHTPIPIHGLDTAMGLKSSPLGYIVFFGGLMGLSLATYMMWWMNASDYPINISGKPFFHPISVIPVMFEATVLISVFTCLGGMLALNRLPRWYNPLFNVDRFSRVTDDAFFISIESSDAKYDATKTTDFLKSIGALNVDLVNEAEEVKKKRGHGDEDEEGETTAVDVIRAYYSPGSANI